MIPSESLVESSSSADGRPLRSGRYPLTKFCSYSNVAKANGFRSCTYQICSKAKVKGALPRARS